MIIKNIFILLTVSFISISAGFYLRPIIYPVQPVAMLTPVICKADEQEAVKHRAASKELRRDRTRIVNNSKGWGF